MHKIHLEYDTEFNNLPQYRRFEDWSTQDMQQLAHFLDILHITSIQTIDK